jgi:CRISPR-associated endonuclease/helicase Cas3
MQGQPSGFWGKLDKDETGTVTQWHPLAAHCADVAACLEALLERTLLRRRLAVLAARQDLRESDVARLAALAALHDIGKVNLGFQHKARKDEPHTAGHVREVLAVLGSDYDVGRRLLDALPTLDLASWCPEGGAMELLVAAIGHHGRPVRCGETGPDPSLWRDAEGLRPMQGIADLSSAVRDWFPAAFGEADVDLPDAPAFQHAFAGLVMLADWLGSDRDFFPFAEDTADRMPFARKAAAAAVSATGLEASSARGALGLEVPGFDTVSAYTPRKAQGVTMGLSRPESGSLTILESETGSDKTEAALGRFLQLFHAGLVDGMVFALPTRTAATQLHTRVVDAMKRAFPAEEARPAVVLAVPGYLRVDEARGRRLTGFEVLWNDDPRDRLRHRGWAAEHPKRYLAGTVVVGTIDQVLMSALRVSHAHMRASTLLRQFLVVDEVHASDAYMNRILEEVLRFHLAAGGHAFLMSATLGTHVRSRLERAALGPHGSASPSLSQSLDVPYPAVHHASRGASPCLHPVGEPGTPKAVRVDVECLADDPGEVAAMALQAARAGARVLVLRNTVSDAIATQVELEAKMDASDPLSFRVGSVVTLHTARFAKEDRELLDLAIEGRFGKHAPALGGVVAVATQTVQQSLDLDADLLLTDLAPMDVLLQRVGRVHRHAERDPVRPEGFSSPRVVVLTAKAPLDRCIKETTGEAMGRHGAGTVYEDLLILEATRRLLAARGRMEIPAENRELVERATHPDALQALAEELGGRWQAHARAVWGTRAAHLGLAGLNLVDRKERFGQYSFQTTQLQERIAARLGDSDRRAVFEAPPLGPFGRRVREITLPGWLTRDVPADPSIVPAGVEQSPGGATRFTFGPLAFLYDRLGLRPDVPDLINPMEDPADA